MPRDGRTQKALTSILAVMLVASCLVAVASLMTPMSAQAAPSQPDGCPPECNRVAACFHCCMDPPGVCCDWWLSKYDCIDSLCRPYTKFTCTEEL